MGNTTQFKARGVSMIGSVALTATLLLPIGCKKPNATVADPTVTAAVQSRLQGDSAISTEPVQVSTTEGTVTLTGQVSNAAARSLAANDAASVQGVQKVVNDITVAPNVPPVSATSTTPQPMMLPAPVPIPRAKVKSRTSVPVTRETPPVVNTPAPVEPAPVQRAQQIPPPPPPAPAVRNVTVPAGSTLPVRITQTLDSDNSHPGDSFTGALAADFVQDGIVVLPRGTSVAGTVVDAKDAGHFKGQSRLSIQLTSISRRGQQIAVSTDPVVKEGAARGKNTAIKTGVGAVGGALLGGIFGGGKGAAIGSIAGGGTGAAINGVTRGEQVSFPSETVVRFSTTNSFLVHVSNRQSTHDGYSGADSGPVLNRQ